MKSCPCATRYLARTRFALMCINRLVQLRQSKINQKKPPNSIGPENSTERPVIIDLMRRRGPCALFLYV